MTFMGTTIPVESLQWQSANSNLIAAHDIRTRFQLDGSQQTER